MSRTARFLAELLFAAFCFYWTPAAAQSPEGDGNEAVVSGGVLMRFDAPLEHGVPTLTYRGVARPLNFDPPPLPMPSQEFSTALRAAPPHATSRDMINPLTWVDDLQFAMSGNEGGTKVGTNFTRNLLGFDWYANAATVVPGLPVIGDPAAQWFRTPDLTLKLKSRF